MSPSPDSGSAPGGSDGKVWKGSSMAFPRLLMPYSSLRLPRAVSTGLMMKNGALNSTIPRSLRGARSRLTIAALSGSSGSTSMCTVPSRRSNAPASPNTLPPA